MPDTFTTLGTGGANRLPKSSRKPDRRKLLLRCIPVSGSRLCSFSKTWSRTQSVREDLEDLEQWTDCCAEKALTAAAELGAGLLEATEGG